MNLGRKAASSPSTDGHSKVPSARPFSRQRGIPLWFFFSAPPGVAHLGFQSASAQSKILLPRLRDRND
jgi:hypothetical protein